MAKDKATKAPKEEKKVFTVADLADELGKEPHEARALLRKHGIEKEEGKYQWSGQKAFDAVVKACRSNGNADEKKAPKNKADEKAPETKAEGKKNRPKPGGSK